MAGAPANDRRSSSRSVTAAHGVRPAASLGQVLVPSGKVGVPQGPAEPGVLDHDDPPGLAVPAVGGEAGRVQQPVDGVVGDVGADEVPHGPGGPEGIDEFHAPDGSGGTDAAVPGTQLPTIRAPRGWRRRRSRSGPARAPR